MSCECITQVNLQLRDEGHTLATLTSRKQHGAQTQSRVLLRTFNTDELNFATPIIVATHCPFCGTKYEG